MQPSDSEASALDRSAMHTPSPSFPPGPRHGHRRTDTQVVMRNADFAKQKKSSPIQQQEGATAAEQQSIGSILVPDRDPYGSSGDYPGYLAVRRSRSPQDCAAPPNQYRDPSRSFGDRFKSRPPNILTSLNATSSPPNLRDQRLQLPVAASVPREAPPHHSSKAPAVERFPFDPARSFAELPRQLVPPDVPGGYNPLANPYIPKPRSPPPLPRKKKPSFWSKAKRKISFNRRSSDQSIRSRSPVSRSRTASLSSSSQASRPSSPYFRPGPPTPSRGRSVSEPQGVISEETFRKSGTRKASKTFLPDTSGFEKIDELLFDAIEGSETAADEEPAANWEDQRFVKRAAWPPRATYQRGISSGVFEEYPASLNPPEEAGPIDPEDWSCKATNNSRSSSGHFAQHQKPSNQYSRSLRKHQVLSRQLKTGFHHSEGSSVLGVNTSGIYRDIEGTYVTTGQVEVPTTAFENAEDSPVPGYLFEHSWNAAADRSLAVDPQQDSPRLRGEADLSLQVLAPPQISRRRQQRLTRSNDRLADLYAAYPDQQLSPDTPTGIGRQHTYLALCGKLPDESLGEQWDRGVKEHTPSRPGGGLGPRGSVEERGDSVSRRRGRAESSQSIWLEEAQKDSEGPETARRLQSLAVDSERKSGGIRGYINAENEVDRERGIPVVRGSDE
jgi:hypothetical protein